MFIAKITYNGIPFDDVVEYFGPFKNDKTYREWYKQQKVTEPSNIKGVEVIELNEGTVKLRLW